MAAANVRAAVCPFKTLMSVGPNDDKNAAELSHLVPEKPFSVKLRIEGTPRSPVTRRQQGYRDKTPRASPPPHSEL